MTLAFAFPGQGAQYVGLGKSLMHLKPYRETFEEASDLFKEDLAQICQTENIHQTKYTQVVLFTAGIATLRLLPKEVQPSLVLGLSLGEYTGVVAAGGATFKDFFPYVQKRGLEMSEVARIHPGKMVAVLNATKEQIEFACQKGQEFGFVGPCNFNTPVQTVIGGEEKALEVAKEALHAQGVRKIIPLAVSGAFHTPLFQEVTTSMAEALKDFPLELKVPLLSNATGKLHSKDTLKTQLTQQISSPVQMVTMSETLKNEGITEVLELGCGKVVGNLIKKNQKSLQTTYIDDDVSLEKFLQRLEVSHV